jgi:hypothetical protein
MFFKYAAVLRKAQGDEVNNKYVTTIFCIVSGILKLSKIMKLPANRFVCVCTDGQYGKDRWVCIS